MTQKSFLLSVAPLTRIPLTRDQSFFYTGKEDIALGSLVEIPIGKRKTKGIVTASHPDFARAGGIDLKPIGEILAVSFLTEKQLLLAVFISEYYICPLGITLKIFTPEIRSAKKTHSLAKLTTISPLEIPSDVQKSLKKIQAHFEKNDSLLMQTMHNKDLKLLLIGLIADALVGTDEQILILVPERTAIPSFEHALEKVFPEQIITTLSTTLTGGQFYENWEKVRYAADKRIIIGSRSALFAPYEKLGHIILMDEHASTHKQWEKSPLYDIRTCAKKYAELHSAKYLAFSPAPQITSYSTALSEKNYLALGENKKPGIAVVDMKIEYNDVNEKKFQKKRPVIARTTRAALERVLKKKQQALLFINRQGKNAFSVCASCETVARCPNCERALVESSRGNHRCLHCTFVTKIFPNCTNCNALTFKTVGLGTETIEEEVRKAFPYAKIARIDSESASSRTDFAKIHARCVAGKVDIIIGTQMALAPWLLSHLALAAVIDMDTLLGGYEYNAHENAYSHTLSLAARLSESESRSPELILQSYDTEHEIVRNLSTRGKKNPWYHFAEGELAMRNILSFPPYTRIIKLLHRDTIKKRQEKEVNALHEKLTTICDEVSGVIISEPHDPLVSKVRTQYKKQIILKVKGDLPQSLQETLITLEKSWLVDRDPASIA